MKLIEQFQSSIDSEFFRGRAILMKNRNFPEKIEKIESEKEVMREKDVNRERDGACSKSYPSGNQVDGLPLVAIRKQQEKKMKRGQESACSTSYSSGNQVDGLPLVAIPKQYEKERAAGHARRYS